jgi:hypothetical protein
MFQILLCVRRKQNPNWSFHLNPVAKPTLQLNVQVFLIYLNVILVDGSLRLEGIYKDMLFVIARSVLLHAMYVREVSSEVQRWQHT